MKVRLFQDLVKAQHPKRSRSFEDHEYTTQNGEKRLTS